MEKSYRNKRKCAWISSSFDDAVEKPTKYTTKQFAVDGECWAEKHTPIHQNELAVHKKKVSEVEQWLRASLSDDKNGILLLTGPSGAGKTATVKVLAKQFQCHLKEWINPVGQEYPDRSLSHLKKFYIYQDSQSQQFSDFLLRANRYNAINMVGNKTEIMSQRIILVEDFPNFAFCKPEKLHNILRRYVHSCRSPLILIISDTQNTDSSVCTLLPKTIQNELNITSISFNPVAVTALVKALKQIVEKELESNSFASFTTPNKDVYSLLANLNNGDVRSCVNALQFYCTDCSPNTASKKASSKSKLRLSKRKPEVKKNLPTNTICGRDASLFLFRALGKLLYCKRLQELEPSAHQLPANLKHRSRRTLNVDPEDIYSRTPVSADTLLLYTHQNYTEFFQDVDVITEASEYFSAADVLNGDWTSRQTMNEYSALLGIRGVMYTNYRPTSCPGTAGSGWRPLHKPQWFEKFKLMNERLQCAGRRGEQHHPVVDWFTETLPYMALIDSSGKKLRPFERDIACFKFHCFPHKVSLETVQDGYVDDVDIDAHAPLTTLANRTEDEQVLSDVEVIEDFDDE